MKTLFYIIIALAFIAIMQALGVFAIVQTACDLVSDIAHELMSVANLIS